MKKGRSRVFLICIKVSNIFIFLYFKNIFYLFHTNNLIIRSETESLMPLSKVAEGYPQTYGSDTYTQLFMYVNLNGLEFCKIEYDNIIMLNNYLIELQRSTGLYSKIKFSIYTLDGITIEFNRLNDDVYIYDEFANDRAWGETIQEFIKR